MKSITKINTFLNIGQCPIHQQYIEFVCEEDKCKANKFGCRDCSDEHKAHYQISTSQYAKRITSLKRNEADGEAKLYLNMMRKNREDIESMIEGLKQFLW